MTDASRIEYAIAWAGQQARDELWRRGVLRWKLHESQQEVYDEIHASKAKRYVMEIARRWGKSYLLALIALETCLLSPGCRVAYCAPSLKHLQEFILPTFDALIADAPDDCRPVFKVSSGHLEFPENGPAKGAHVHLFGADDKRKASRGRGADAKMCIFDEAGFTPVLEYVLTDVFKHQLRHGDGRMLLGSTPAEEPEHGFTKIAETEEADGNYSRRTIYENPLFTAEQIDAFILEDARQQGMSIEDYKLSDSFRRECLAERVVNKLLVVVPEWEGARARLIQRVERPKFFRGMTTLDWGGADPHAVHFGYWHPTLGKSGAYVIEDELLLRDDENSQELADAIKAKERALWGVNKWDGTMGAAYEGELKPLLGCVPEWMQDMLYRQAQPQPWIRVADNDLQLVRDMYELHRVAFIPTAKDNKQLQVNNLRVLIRESAFFVDPRCVQTDRHLKATTWKDHKRKDYARRGGEHGDLVDCATYAVRNLDRRDSTPVDELQLTGDAPVGAAIRQLEARQASNLNTQYLGGTRLGRRLMRKV